MVAEVAESSAAPESYGPSIAEGLRNAESASQAIQKLVVASPTEAARSMLECAQKERDAIRQRRDQAKPTWARMQSVETRIKAAQKKRDQLVGKAQWDRW